MIIRQKRAPGREKGIAKVPGSGRKKGSSNKLTILKGDLERPLPSDIYLSIQDKIAELALAGNVQAARVWFEEYRKPLPPMVPNIKGDVESFEDLDKTGESIVKDALRGKLDVQTARDLMSVLLQKRELKAGALLPLMKDMIDQRLQETKGKR